MAIILESYEIDSPEHGRSFKIDLVEGMDGAHIDFIERQWLPILQRQHDLALLNFFRLPVVSQTDEKWTEMLGKFGAQDWHWKWRSKCSVAAGTNRRIYALLNADDVEAAMCLLFGKQSRDSNPLPIVYVDYVAVAPWNRQEVQNPRRFPRFGTVMLGAAVEVSMSMGFEGRCGLHSLPQSEGFYRKARMSDFGIDTSYLSLRYFEFSNQAAKVFLNR